MTPEQIKTLIDQKIAGQGSMVDIGGALPTILKEIVDSIQSIPSIPVLTISSASMTAKELTSGEVSTFRQNYAFVDFDNSYLPLTSSPGDSAELEYIRDYIENWGGMPLDDPGAVFIYGKFKYNYDKEIEGFSGLVIYNVVGTSYKYWGVNV